MTQPYASSRVLTLQDLMDQAGGAVAPPDVPSAASSSTDSLSPEETYLYRMLTDPNADTKPREVQKPNRLAQMLMGLGDAANSYASIIGSAPNIKSNNLEEYMQYLQRQKMSTEMSNKQLAENAARRKLEGATFLYDRKLRSEQKKADATAKAEELAWRKTQVDQANADRDAARAQTKALNDADNATRIAIEKMGNDNRIAVANAEARLHADRAKGEGDKAQHQVYVQLKGAIVAKKREYDQMLAEGKITPEQIDAEWADIRAAVDLDPNGTYAAAADAFFKDQIDPIKMKYAPQQGPGAQQPYDPAALAAGAGTLPIDTSRDTLMRQGNLLNRRAP